MLYLTYKHHHQTGYPCAAVYREKSMEWEEWMEADFIVEVHTGKVVKNRWGVDMVPYGRVKDYLPPAVHELIVSLWIVLAHQETS